MVCVLPVNAALLKHAGVQQKVLVLCLLCCSEDVSERGGRYTQRALINPTQRDPADKRASCFI